MSRVVNFVIAAATIGVFGTALFVAFIASSASPQTSVAAAQAAGMRASIIWFVAGILAMLICAALVFRARARAARSEAPIVGRSPAPEFARS